MELQLLSPRNHVESFRSFLEAKGRFYVAARNGLLRNHIALAIKVDCLPRQRSTFVHAPQKRKNPNAQPCSAFCHLRMDLQWNCGWHLQWNCSNSQLLFSCPQLFPAADKEAKQYNNKPIPTQSFDFIWGTLCPTDLNTNNKSTWRWSQHISTYSLCNYRTPLLTQSAQSQWKQSWETIVNRTNAIKQSQAFYNSLDKTLGSNSQTTNTNRT